MPPLVVALLLVLAAAPAWADDLSPFGQCEAAVAVAEKAARPGAKRAPSLPDGLMPAISRVESGRLDPGTKRVRAWPWTINVGGTGYFFDNKDQAMSAVRAFPARGVQSIAVGCMQGNLLYHPAAFASLDDAFDPVANARYAARFLLALYGQTRDWNLAAANYHSSNADRGEEYQRRVFGRVMTPMGPKTALVLPTGPYGVWPPPGSTYAALPPVSFAFGAFAPAPGASPPGRVAVQLPPLRR